MALCKHLEIDMLWRFVRGRPVLYRKPEKETKERVGICKVESRRTMADL